MNSEEMLKDLFRRQNFGIKLGLEMVDRMLSALGNPHREFGVVHVAGTNGKGSVCAMLESVLRHAGVRTGLYTSPHLVRFTERMRVNGLEMSEWELCTLIQQVGSVTREVEKELGREATFFEYGTVLAFEHFRRSKVKLAVVETGMGGRLDATNVVMPLVAAITRVSLEHTVHLGDTIEAIAREKAGIIKTGRPVVMGPTDSRVLPVISQVAKERNAPILNAEANVSVACISEDISGQKLRVESQSNSYGTVHLRLLGQHQVENTATVITILDALSQFCGIDVEASDVKSGLAAATWPGRLQLLRRDPPVLLDGAHNPGAAQSLALSLDKLFKPRKIGLVMGMCNDKDVKGFLQPFAGMTGKAWVVPIPSERNMATEDIVATGRSLGLSMTPSDIVTAILQAQEWARQSGGVVCIAGSLFLVGEVLRLEGLGAIGEKRGP